MQCFFSKNLYLSIDKYPMGVYITNCKENTPLGYDNTAVKSNDLTGDENGRR